MHLDDGAARRHQVRVRIDERDRDIERIGSVALVSALKERFTRELGLRVSVLTPMPLSDGMLNRQREQFDSDKMIAAIWERYPGTRTERVLTIGVTPADMFIPTNARWRFAFGALLPFRDQRGGTAIVSANRMPAEDWRVRPGPLPLVVRRRYDDAKVDERAAKMVRKYIALTHFGLASSHDPDSPVFDRILGVTDLDRMSEVLATP